MAVASIAVPPDPKRDAKAALLAPLVGSWPLFTLNQPFGSFEAGSQFRQATGSKGEKYLVNAVACQCIDYAESGNVCKHIRAIVLHEAAAVAASAPKRRSYADLFPPCAAGCGELVERTGERCYACLSAETRRLDQARQASR